MKASGVVVYSFDGLNHTLNTIAFHLNNKPSVWFIANATSKNFFLQNLVSFGIYAITRTPGQAESHTLYFKGLYGDIFSQMTRSDAALITDASSGSKSSNSFDVATSTELLSFAKGDDFPPNSFVKGFFCEDIAGSCSAYYVNTAKYYYVRSAFRVVGIINTVEYDVFVWVMLVIVLYLVYIQSRRHRRDVARYVSTMIYAKRTLSVTPSLIVSILFTFTQCGLVSGGGKKGEAPWILLASGINNDTPSVDEVPTTVNTVTPSSPNAPIGSIPPTGSGNNTNTNGSGGYRPSGAGGGSGGSALVPVTGMYFLHPDHLGSITMITDGRGNVIAGGNNGGKSHISYKPYGEIHRTDSSGPDITRFKYTGQEEDKESGLMYYKARYYDPMVGRFLQADNEYNPDDTQGMNHYMYVNGSPMNFRDRSGNSCDKHLFGQIGGAIGAFYGGMYGGPAGARAGYSVGAAATGVAPGHNWTGGGGDCGRNKPTEFLALQWLFRDEIAKNPMLYFLLDKYYEDHQASGKETILDGLNTNRRAYTGLLIGLVVSGVVKGETAAFVFYLMTHGVAKPARGNGIDRGSYNHDMSNGSTIVWIGGAKKEDPRKSNRQWIKNAWASADDPYDVYVATVGTVLFSTANVINDLTHIKENKHHIKPGRFPKLCGRTGSCNIGGY